MEQIIYRKANEKDLYQIAEVFLAAFPESVEHYTGSCVSEEVLIDVFRMCLNAEPDALIVATINGQVPGYIFAPSDLTNVFRTAVMHGFLLRMFAKWLARQYNIGIKPVSVAAKNWLHMWHESHDKCLRHNARILSVAVSPS